MQMGTVGVLEYAGRQILVIDLSHCDLEDTVRLVGEAKAFIARQERGSLLTLTDVTGARVTPALTRVMKEFAAHNKPFVRAGAVVGLSGVMGVIYEAVVKFSGRELPAFPTRREALTWLAAR